jgi:hypothetical protein
MSAYGIIMISDIDQIHRASRVAEPQSLLIGGTKIVIFEQIMKSLLLNNISAVQFLFYFREPIE